LNWAFSVRLKVMPFGLMNAPAFYTCMMQDFREEWHTLFIITICSMKLIGGQVVKILETDEIYLDGVKAHSEIKGIIDDILMWSTNLEYDVLYARLLLIFLVSDRVYE